MAAGIICTCKQYLWFPLQCEISLAGDGGTCKKLCRCHKVLLVPVLVVLSLFVASTVIGNNYAETVSWWNVSNARPNPVSNAIRESVSLPKPGDAPNSMQGSVHAPIRQSVPNSLQSHILRNSEDRYEESCHAGGPLPKGLVQKTSDLEMRQLWGNPEMLEQKKFPQNLLAIPVGIKQKENVDQMIQKFPSDNFTVMLFHYDGATDKWSDLEWNNRAIHVAAVNQTKWWFAKRFLHPDIVAAYNYIFLWDEDLGVENFHADRYLAIMEDEGLEISQPALDAKMSEVHFGITVRARQSRVHRRFYKTRGGGLCYENSTGPPCTGWVEMMAPVFSRAAWHCSWGMIQNDLIHGWGLDMKLGYCAQGDRSKKVGVIDSEYIVHKGIPSLGRLNDDKPNETFRSPFMRSLNATIPGHVEDGLNIRGKARRRAFDEMEIFRWRWATAVRHDKCWVDPYRKPGRKLKSERKAYAQRSGSRHV